MTSLSERNLMIFKEKSIYEMIEMTSKRTDSPSTAVFCRIYKDIMNRCNREIKSKIPLARKENDCFSEPEVCGIDYGIDFIRISSNIAKRIIVTNKGYCI